MNATSSLGLPTMEDPFTDTMEMASPYNGHVDDFEIDIDIMDDQPANVDNDFDLQDATPDEATGEFAHDADMMDDVPEMTVTDTSTYNNDGNMQYTNNTFSTAQEPVESEMVDEQYEEDVNPVSTSFETFTASQGDAKSGETVEVVNDQQVTEAETKDEGGNHIFEEISEGAQTVLEEKLVQELNHEESGEATVDAPREPQAEPTTESHFEYPVSENKESVEESNELAPFAGPGAENEAAKEADVVENNAARDLPPTGESEEAVKNEIEPAEQISLFHQVKVIYQESEISMFPPRHGNTSETYFLSDEGLAHERIDRLFKECRAILGEHASNEDSLVFHIDSLGIELSEDNTHVSKITLSQIVDTYLHLCRNSGIEQPEPLYLSLSTRAHLSSELAALVNAAKEGKGIADIQSWDEEYEHAESEDARASTRADLPEPDVNEQERNEQAHLAEENEGLDKDAEGKGHENTHDDFQDGSTDSHGLHEAENDSNKLENNQDQKEELQATNEEDHNLAGTQSNLERVDGIEENESLHVPTPEPIRETGSKQVEESKTGPVVEETVAHDFARDGIQESSANGPTAVDDSTDSHVEQHDGNQEEEVEVPAAEEEAAIEDRVTATELTEASENVTTTEQKDETGGYEDDNEDVTAGQEEIVGPEEAEYNEEADEQHFEDYAEEEYHEDDLQYEDNQALAGDEEVEEFPEDQNDGSYVADQFDQASSKTVSALNEPADRNDDLSANLQPGTETDVNTVFDYNQDIPDLPDDNLLDLDDDIFADTAQAPLLETEDSNGHDTSAGQVNTAEDAAQNLALKRQGSTVGKRPRSDEEEEEEFDFDGVPSPGAKRTRSS